MLLRNKTDSKREMEQLAKEMAELSEEAEHSEETEEDSQSGMHFKKMLMLQ